MEGEVRRELQQSVSVKHGGGAVMVSGCISSRGVGGGLISVEKQDFDPACSTIWNLSDQTGNHQNKRSCSICSDSLDVLFLFSRCSTFAQNACCSHVNTLVGWLPVRTDASLLIARWANFPHDSMNDKCISICIPTPAQSWRKPVHWPHNNNYVAT